MRFRDNNLFINTVLLGGTTEEKIRAAAEAGFGQIEIWRQDIEAAGGNPAEIARQLKHHSLGLTDYQVLLDIDGAPDGMQKQKRKEALAMLDIAVALGATTLLAPASTHPDCIAERETDDLYWLAREAAKRDLRVAFEAMAWSTHINTTNAAWRCVEQINEPNLGLVTDAFHIFARNRTVADLAGIPMNKIFLVQLSDLQALPTSEEVKETARHHRLLPGEGNFPLQSLLNYLAANRYSGPLGLEVFSDMLSHKPPREVAGEAMQALRMRSLGPIKRLIPQNGRPMHNAPLRQIVGVGVVLGDAVIPDGDIVRLPAPAHLKFRLCNMGKQKVQQCLTLFFAQFDNPRGKAFVNKQRLFAADRMGTHDRVE